MDGETQSSMGEGTADSKEKTGDTGLDSIENLTERIFTVFCRINQAQKVERGGDVMAGKGPSPPD